MDMLTHRRKQKSIEHSIDGCLSHDRRLVQAALRGRIRQPEQLIDELLECHPAMMPGHDIVDMVVNGRIFC